MFRYIRIRSVLSAVMAILAGAGGAAGQADLREVEILARAPADGLWCSPVSGGYDEVPVFREYERERCGDVAGTLGVDFARQRMIFWAAGGDCHMRAVVKAFRSDSERRVRVVVNNIYGGCRAAGRKAGWIVIEKPPPGYRVGVTVVVAGRGADDQFVLPLPPPTVTRVDVPVRVVDLAGCLPLPGQSRWLISSTEHLRKALAGRENEQECTALIAGMKIDLERETLAGAAFASGYCGKPEGLNISMTKETSTDKRNYYVMNAVYDDPVQPCETWATFPVWVAAPRMESGHLLEVHARPRSRVNEPRVPEKKIVEWIER